MTAISCTAIEALRALQSGYKVRCIHWDDGKYIEVVGDLITLNDRQGNPIATPGMLQLVTMNSILENLVFNNEWETLEN